MANNPNITNNKAFNGSNCHLRSLIDSITLIQQSWQEVAIKTKSMGDKQENVSKIKKHSLTREVYQSNIVISIGYEARNSISRNFSKKNLYFLLTT